MKWRTYRACGGRVMIWSCVTRSGLGSACAQKMRLPNYMNILNDQGFFFFYQWIYFFPDAALMQDSSGSDCERATERAWEVFLDMDSSPQRIFETCSRRLYALGWISSVISSKHKDHNSALWWKLLEIAAKCRKVAEQHCLSNSEFKHEIECEELPRFSWMG